MAGSTSSKELPEHIRKSVEEALKRVKISEPIVREWDIIGFILREKLALEAVADKAQQIASHVGASAQAGNATAAAAAASKGPHPVAGFLGPNRIICGFLPDPAMLRQ